MARPSAFSVYASHFINATNALNKSFAPPSESTEPLFFSVTEGSHLGDDESPRDHNDDRDNESEMGEDGFPRLVGSELFGVPEDSDSDGDQFRGKMSSSLNAAGPSSSTTRALRPPDDPYLDDTDIEDALNQDIPLIRSPSPSSPRQSKRLHTQGWLAHFSNSRQHSPLRPRSPSSSPPLSPRSSSSEPPDYLFGRAPTPPPTRTALSESLLPRDGISRSLFTLPEPGRIPRRKYNDYAWTAAWCTGLLCCGVGSVVVLFVTTTRKKSDKPPTPYITITHAIPLLTFITILSSAVSYVHLILLRFAVRPVLMGTALAVPVALVLGSAWSFAGSFFWEEGAESTWGETVGLRLFSVVPLICAFFAARSLYNRRKALLRTVSVVELSTTVVLNHPPILLLSLGLLLVALIASIPFLSLILRLTLIGYYTSEPGTAAWHIRGYAGWLAFLATVIWVWSWGVVRGILKVAVSGVVGDWYFNNLEPEPARPTAYEVTHAAFGRASGPSLGSICVSTLVLTFTQVTIFILRSLRRISTPPQLYFLASLHPLELIAGLIAILDSLGSYTLTYIGLTGEKFWVSAKQSRELVSSSGKGSRSKGSRAGDYSLLSYLLLLSSLSVALFAAVGGYVFAAHTLSGPANAPLMALLTGGVTFMTVRFGIGVGEDAADALFLCYRIDLNAGAEHCREAFEAFEGNRQQAPGEP